MQQLAFVRLPGSTWADSTNWADALPPLLSLQHVDSFPNALPACKMGRLSRSIHPSNKHLSSTYCMPGTVLGTGDEVVN